MKTVSQAAQIAGFIDKYSPEIARDFRASRRKMRALFPRGYELVYDNYNALGIGYGAGSKASDVVLSIVAFPRWVSLFFLHGVSIEDPDSLLEGKGSRVRSIRLQSPNDLGRADIRRLMSQAMAPHAVALAMSPRLSTSVKAVMVKQRGRRPRK